MLVAAYASHRFRTRKSDTLEDGKLHTTLTLLADAEGDFSLTFFQTEDSSMYANLEYNNGKNALKTMFLLVPMK